MNKKSRFHSLKFPTQESFAFLLALTSGKNKADFSYAARLNARRSPFPSHSSTDIGLTAKALPASFSRKIKISATALFLIIFSAQAVFADSHGNFPGKGSREKWIQAVNLTDQAMAMKGPTRVKDGIPLVKKAIGIYPYDGKIYYVLANRYASKKDFFQAESSYRKATELEPDFTDAWYNLGIILYESYKYADSKKAFEKMLKCPHTIQDAKAASFYLKEIASKLSAPPSKVTGGKP